MILPADLSRPGAARQAERERTTQSTGGHHVCTRAVSHLPRVLRHRRRGSPSTDEVVDVEECQFAERDSGIVVPARFAAGSGDVRRGRCGGDERAAARGGSGRAEQDATALGAEQLHRGRDGRDVHAGDGERTRGASFGTGVDERSDDSAGVGGERDRGGAAGASGLASAASGGSNLTSMSGIAGIAGAAGAATGGMSQGAVKSAAVTVATAMVPGAALIGPATSAAAPVATGIVKGIAGRFSHAETKERMTKDLQSGRLVVKGIRFADGSDAFAEGSDQVVALLASAIDGVPGAFAMRLAAESDGKASADTSLARRRLERVAGYLQLSGITDARVALVAPTTDKPAKPGEARVELARVGDGKP